MAGLTHLSEVLVKQGRDFIQNLLTLEVTATEKLDGSNFNVEKQNNGFVFYKRDGKTPINSIDRMLSIYHEAPIKHFETLPKEVIDGIPNGTYFSFEYFASAQPVEILYHQMPKNNLVLESVRLKNGKYVYDKTELDQWADLLNVEKVPIIFQGVLSDEQRMEIISFVSTPFEKLVDKFQTNSFSRYILNLLNPNIKQSFLKNSIDDIIEGVVFSFKGDNIVFAKIVDPLFTAMVKNKNSKDREEPGDIYGMIVSDITDFINNVDLNNYIISGKDFSSGYINLMSQLFLEYFHLKGTDYKDVYMNVPKFLEKPEHQINLKAVPYKKIEQIIRTNKNYAELFKIFIATYRKKKKKVYGYFTKDFINVFNNTVDKIHSIINQSINEITINDVNSFALINEDEEILNGYNIIQEFNEVTVIEIPENLQNIENKTLIVTPAENKVNVIVGRFQPLHKGHIGISKFLKEANGHDTVFVIIRGNKPNKKSPITLELQNKLFEEVQKNEPHIVGSFVTNRVILNEIFTLLRSNGYEPISLGAGDDRVESYNEQLDFMLNKRNNMMNVDSDFSIIQIPRNIIKASGTSIRESIKNDDLLKFNSQMPNYLYKFYFDIKGELEHVL